MRCWILKLSYDDWYKGISEYYPCEFIDSPAEKSEWELEEEAAAGRAALKAANAKMKAETAKKESEYVEWIGTKEQLAKAVEALFEEGCIPKERQFQSVAQHFMIRNRKTGKLEKVTNKELSSKAAKTPDSRKSVKKVKDALKKSLTS